MQHLPSGSGATSQRDWRYSNLMSFLVPFMPSRSTTGNLEASEPGQNTQEEEAQEQLRGWQSNTPLHPGADTGAEAPTLCHCKMVQPVKKRLKIALSKFEAKREEWAYSRKKNHNMASMKQDVVLLLEKLQAAGYKPVLLLGKATKKSHGVQVFIPRCTLATFAEESLKKMGSIHEYICEDDVVDPITVDHPTGTAVRRAIANEFFGSVFCFI
ncbi:unnamed protein product [Arctogadus glacialis]